MVAASVAGVEADINAADGAAFTMSTAAGDLSRPYAGFRYIASAGNAGSFLGDGLAAKATVDQWVEFSRNELVGNGEISEFLASDGPMLAALVNMGVRGTSTQKSVR